jgi:hypothetical protein
MPQLNQSNNQKQFRQHKNHQRKRRVPQWKHLHRSQLQLNNSPLLQRKRKVQFKMLLLNLRRKKKKFQILVKKIQLTLLKSRYYNLQLKIQ